MRAPPLYIAALGIVEWFIELPGGPLLMAVACSPPLLWGLRLWMSKKKSHLIPHPPSPPPSSHAILFNPAICFYTPLFFLQPEPPPPLLLRPPALFFSQSRYLFLQSLICFYNPEVAGGLPLFFFAIPFLFLQSLIFYFDPNFSMLLFVFNIFLRPSDGGWLGWPADPHTIRCWASGPAPALTTSGSKGWGWPAPGNTSCRATPRRPGRGTSSCRAAPRRPGRGTSSCRAAPRRPGRGTSSCRAPPKEARQQLMFYRATTPRCPLSS